MIPLHLRIAGFLSYQDPVELDFDSFELACISGQNGAGKSSLLDAFTWSLFGEARGKSADVINLNQEVKAAEVVLTFAYENNIYRVQRVLPRGKSTVLEFQVLDQTVEADSPTRFGGEWRALTEKTTRDTQARIEQTLRLDYETFTNASFFLQGQADQFTQKKASERKAVLSAILGLEIWETYKSRTAEKRKALEGEVNSIDGRIVEIDAELAEEGPRKLRLQELEKTLKQITSARETQDALLASLRNTTAIFKTQKTLVETLESALQSARRSLSTVENKMAEKENEQREFSALAGRAKEIERLHKKWQGLKKQLEELEHSSFVARDYEAKRQPLVEAIAAEKNQLETEKEVLNSQFSGVRAQLAEVERLEATIASAQKALTEVEQKRTARAALENRRNEAKEKLAGLKFENEALRKEMDEYKARIDALEKTESAECPVCGQALTEAHRAATLKELKKDGKVKGDQFRKNKDDIADLEKQIANAETQLTSAKTLDDERLQFSNSLSTGKLKLESIHAQHAEWEKTGAKRLKEINQILAGGQFAVAAQKELAQFDAELVKLGYDISRHEATRNEELELREAAEDYARLEKARDLNERISAELKELQAEKEKREKETAAAEAKYADAQQEFAKTEAQTPNLPEAENRFYELKAEENRIRDEMGAARQRVDVLETLRARRQDATAQREAFNQNIAQHKSLERAFGKDGVPALLIEQALPQIEQKANDLLERLSAGQMSIRFVTQAGYKDKKRDDLKETLEIQISDAAGARDYEMYSGGEAFRVNFAIRLALSEILAQRKGARLQTLVIDEGFGSQDTQGREKLVEAINLVKNDFAKILVITHLEELKDAFPNRIEVEKTERGSSVKVV
ncbi:MAG: SMC family ATPase [Anaerolineales bacterium]|nr:SMC family ATPase [Anaerolineales bacterium]